MSPVLWVITVRQVMYEKLTLKINEDKKQPYRHIKKLFSYDFRFFQGLPNKPVRQVIFLRFKKF